jgi:four helix bundle protein
MHPAEVQFFAFVLPVAAASSPMGDYHKLQVWQKSIDLVTEVYSSTRVFPDDEVFGLRLQMRRAAVSVCSNIAEGQGRFTAKDYRNFIVHARGSLLELETQVVICERLGYIAVERCNSLKSRTREVGKMLNGLLKYLTSEA